MSHELEDNLERRKRILAKMRQYPKGLSLLALHRIIMDLGYNLRGAKDKVKELHYGGKIREQNGLWFDAETLSRTCKREEGS
ncbi:MAG: hypothetical protein ACFFCD_16620 [Promethearchaeota archaeon]